MQVTDILTLLFGLAATILGILFKGEYDKRMTLQQQVSEHKRKAYAAFNETMNEFLAVVKQNDPTINLARSVKQLMELRQGIWQYGSDDVVKAYALWQQCVFTSGDENDHSSAALILMADLIVKMRQDLGLSKGNSLTSLDILRVFVNDIEVKYDEMANIAREFRKNLSEAKHVRL